MALGWGPDHYRGRVGHRKKALWIKHPPCRHEDESDLLEPTFKNSHCAVITALGRLRQEDSGLPDSPALSCMCGEPKARGKRNRRLENHTGDKGLQLASQLTLGIPKHRS